ncbi:FhuF 2Fe-2S C-terminal domain-containing protein [Actinacidiphila alni]|uniref:FhuF 2Fe-2S C-terminal domain-containing protein n=2 Tax=Actinacidiphila alni TaxID=380248 RepID=A0A1I2B774_9ACTN|nr:FhuF 2Fe-2S C-terminal domain-containing protein [Actinacidiphila alni]
MSLGPFFAAEGHSASPLAPGAGLPDPAPGGEAWRSMGELADGGPALAERVAGVRRYLAAMGGGPPETVETRVAASVAHLGLVARVLSPMLALAVLRGEVASGLRLADLRWRPVLGGPFPLSLPDPPPGDDLSGAPLEALAAALARDLLDGPVRELTDAFAPFRVSPHILRGNTASALNGAAGMLAAARPADAGRVRSLAAALLDRPPLRGTSTREGTAEAGAYRFRRRSCCLIYRAAPGRAGALCGDCALASV